MSRTRSFVLLIAIAHLAPAAASQQETTSAHRGRTVFVPRLPFSVTDAHVYRDRVVIKFREGTPVRLARGDLVALGGDDLGSVRRTLRDATVERLFTRPVDGLDRERVELQQKVPPNDAPLADLNNYYRVWTLGARETERLVNTLNRDALIETAYAEFIPVLAEDIPPTTPNWEPNQGYLDPAPSGLGYWPMQSIVGARFQNGQLAHLEGGWIEDHEDCDWLTNPNYVGLPPSGIFLTTWVQHGSACVGVLAGGRNLYGVRGFACDTKKMWFLSLANGSANIVSFATELLNPGDVMSSSFVYAIAPIHAPRDLPQADWDAIRVASIKGIHYTYSAGNTSTDIDNEPLFYGRWAPTAASSGGYIVGATEAINPVRINWSNFGATHVISNGWGQRIYTMGYGSLFAPNNDPRQYYTAIFGGTSSTASQLAGVIASFVGAVKEQNGRVLTVAEVKAALRATGTPIPNGAVGNRPDLAQLLAINGLPDGLLATADGPPGGSWSYEVTGNVGELYTVLFSPNRANIPFGLNRPFLIDPATLTVLEGGNLSTAKKTTTLQIPNSPALKDTDYYIQAIFVRGGTFHFSNSAALWVF